MKLTVEVGLSKIPGDMEDMQVDPPDTLQFRITWLLIPDGRVDGVGATRLPNPFRVTRKQFGPVRASASRRLQSQLANSTNDRSADARSHE